MKMSGMITKEIVQIAKVTERTALIGEKIAKAIDKAPIQLHIFNFGREKGITLIGQSMDRVKQVRDSLKEVERLTVNTFEASEGASDAYFRAFGKLRSKLKPGEIIPDKEFIDMKIYKENQAWIK